MKRTILVSNTQTVQCKMQQLKQLRKYEDADFTVSLECVDGRIAVHNTYTKWSPAIFKRFIRVILLLAKEEGYPIVFCNILCSNTVTHRYVKKLGFKRVFFLNSDNPSILYKVNTKCLKRLERLLT